MKATEFLFLLLAFFSTCDVAAELRVGAAAVDITPEKLPVIVNGSLLAVTTDEIVSRLHARAIVLDDGRERLGIVVVDSCMTPRPFLDEAKKVAVGLTKIRADRMLISATHCHSAPSIMDNMVAADPNYVPYLRSKLAEALAKAEANLEPARVGWATVNAAKFTATRRWILRPDRIRDDVFGDPTVRATMHAAADWDNVTGPSGPEDPDLALISFQAHDGRPIAVLGNFSMHYFTGHDGLSSDYYGLFSEGLKARLAKDGSGQHPPFVGVMSHGCSGDIWRKDYALPDAERYMPTMEDYTSALLDLAMKAYGTLEHRPASELAMLEKRLTLKYRVPDVHRLKWARDTLEAMGERDPENVQEAYAREQIVLHDKKSTEVVVQAIRIGDIGIATTPTETYALTGLKLKLQSPLPKTMVFDLANGADGYIPPPEQHFLGGYNTWPMRGAGLEVQAEPIITEVALELLERVAGRSRRSFQQSRGPAAAAILDSKPAAYWRFDDFEGSRAIDSSGRGHDGFYEPGVAFFLEGPRSEIFCSGGEQNRAVHFAGGRLRGRPSGLGERYSVSLWFWNGMPLNAREISGWMFSRGRDHGSQGDHLGVGGTRHVGKLVFQANGQLVAGSTECQRWQWNHAVFVRDGEAVRVYLNGKLEIEMKAALDIPSSIDEVFVGGRSDRQSNWEGRLDECAVFVRALSGEECEKLAHGSH
jgi:hypothetical protein